MNSTPRSHSATLWLKFSAFALAICLLLGTVLFYTPNKGTPGKQKTAVTELSVLQKMKPIAVKVTKPIAKGDTGDFSWKNNIYFKNPNLLAIDLLTKNPIPEKFLLRAYPKCNKHLVEDITKIIISILN